MKRSRVGAGAVLTLAGAVVEQQVPPRAAARCPRGGVDPRGQLSTGSVDRVARPDEPTVHRVRVGGFRMDRTEVTSARFTAFVAATGNLTVAERPIDWHEPRKQIPDRTPKAADERLKPGSLVFVARPDPAGRSEIETRFKWRAGANCQHPDPSDRQPRTRSLLMRGLTNAPARSALIARVASVHFRWPIT